METITAMRLQIIQNAMQSALARSARAALWLDVRPGKARHTYLVPSQSRDGFTHLVSVRKRQHPGEPLQNLYACSCEARHRPACIHRAAVFQMLFYRFTGAVPTGMAQSLPSQHQAPTPASP